jgi:predicted phosphohydrolase
MKLFAIGDLHLSFSSDKPMDVFGEHWRKHYLRLEDNWKNLVSDDDTVLVPGDISWAMDIREARQDLAWLHELPGRKIIVKGNHDYWWPSMRKLRGSLQSSIVPLQHDAIRVDPVVVAGTRGWLTPEHEDFQEERDGKTYRRELLRLEMALDRASEMGSGTSALVFMIHYPPISGGRGTEFSRMISERGVDICVYGHIHAAPGKWPEGTDVELNGVRYILVSADRLGFKPMELEV